MSRSELKALVCASLILIGSTSSAQTTVTNPVTLAWDANPPAELVARYQLVIDQTTIDVGPVTTYGTTLPPGSHTATVEAINVMGVKSGPSAPVAFVVAPIVSDDCGGHPVSIQIFDWTKTVPVGSQGTVYFRLINPYPVVRVEARLNAQAIGALDGTDLRGAAGIVFSVPRTPGAYGVTVFAKDNAGCFSVTTLARSVVVQ